MPFSEGKRGRPRSDKVDDAVLHRIYEVTGWRTQKELCEGVGEFASTLSRSLSRGDGVPEIFLWKVAYTFQVRLEWLQTGEGPREHPLVVDLLPLPLQEAVTRLLHADPALQRSLADTARVFDEAQQEWIVSSLQGAIRGALASMLLDSGQSPQDGAD